MHNINNQAIERKSHKEQGKVGGPKYYKPTRFKQGNRDCLTTNNNYSTVLTLARFSNNLKPLSKIREDGASLHSRSILSVFKEQQYLQSKNNLVNTGSSKISLMGERGRKEYL